MSTDILGHAIEAHKRIIEDQDQLLEFSIKHMNTLW